MPDFSGLYRVDDAWITLGAADDVMRRLAGAVGAAPPAEGHPLEINIGSRLAMRTMGFLVPARKVPLRLVVEVVQHNQGTQVLAQAVSNQGWYAMSASRFTSRVYDRALTELMQMLRTAAPPASRHHQA